MKLTALWITIFFLLPTTMAAEPRDAKDTVQEIAALTADMTQFTTLLRLSEDISFWQGVSIMGAQYDWEFNYSEGGENVVQWTYRLYNSLDETLSEGVAASRAIARSRVLTDDEKAAGKALFAQFEEMRAHGEEVYRLLKDGDTLAAAGIYEKNVIQLRRDISISATSAVIQLRDRIKKIALDVRLGR